MPRTWTAFTTLVTTKLQSSGSADFSVAEVDYGLQEALKEFATIAPHLVTVVLKLEGRYGDASSTSADNLIDTTKGHFVSTDPADEKVIHNTTDNTWAVVLSQASTAQVGLSSDIMAVSEHYEIYNRFCRNRRQVYIGDIPEYEKVDSVEYPMGTRRSFIRYDRVLEVNIGRVPDTNTNTAKVTNLPDDQVLVRFNMPHQLSPLTDWAATFSATAAAAATSIALTALQGAGTIDVGSQLTIENHRTTYLVASSATIASSAVTLSIYPPLEADVSSTGWVVTFRQTSLGPHQEEIFADLAAARIIINKAPKLLRTIPLGASWRDYMDWGERRLEETLEKLRASVPPKTKQTYPRY